MLQPTVLVVAKGDEKGTGTVIFSERLTVRVTQKASGSRKIKRTREIQHTYVLTNWHVIDSNISVNYAKRRRMLHGGYITAMREKWEAKRTPLKVHVFEYAARVGTLRKRVYQADIVACSKEHDLALLRLRTSSVLKHVAAFAPEQVELSWGETTWLAGCAREVPLLSEGKIGAFHKDKGEKMAHLCTTTSISAGDSGGGMYRHADARGYELIGIASSAPGSLGVELPVSNTTYSVPIQTIREFLGVNSFGFILKNRECKPAA